MSTSWLCPFLPLSLLISLLLLVAVATCALVVHHPRRAGNMFTTDARVHVSLTIWLRGIFDDALCVSERGALTHSLPVSVFFSLSLWGFFLFRRDLPSELCGDFEILSACRFPASPSAWELVKIYAMLKYYSSH